MKKSVEKQNKKEGKGFFSRLFGSNDSKSSQGIKKKKTALKSKPRHKRKTASEIHKKLEKRHLDKKNAINDKLKARTGKLRAIKEKNERTRKINEARKKKEEERKKAEQRKRELAHTEAEKKAKIKKEKEMEKKRLRQEEKNQKMAKIDKKKSIKGREEKEKKQEFLKTYIPGFDELCKEGIPVGNSVLVEGGPGGGKTIFCLTLMKNMCERGKKVLYMSFEEREERLREHMKVFGAKPEEYEKKGLLYVKRFNALDIARSVEALLSEAKKELLIDVQPVLIPPEFNPDVVLIDSLSSISSAFSGEESRFRIYMEQLFRYLERHDITSFLIREVANPAHVGGTFVEKGEAVSFLSDGIIVMYNVFYKDGKRKRACEILKMRGTNINRKIIECEIQGGKGIVFYPKRTLKGKYTLT